jgi:uncharacterized membrane protein
MEKNRLEAFSDGVIAIIITIMVLELKVPHGDRLDHLIPLLPVFLSYILSFIYIAIYWNNHHHMLYASRKVTGRILWANMYWLFWISLIPVTTAWMGENHFAMMPVALYGVVFFMSGIAYYVLSKCLANHHENTILAQAVGENKKAMISVILYAIAIPLAFIQPKFSLMIYAAVAIVWFIPDRRIEKTVHE